MKKVTPRKSIKVLNSKKMRSVTGGDATETTSVPHKKLSDVAPILIGGVLIGAAAQ
ncbi:hypothetical protein [Chryseobacterium shigense]|uniref:Uncharacterized protein n=1 Tax=Chryseobacterium shigense TaxID=297244 RepID=A0A841MX26_9FLAO|nr:hypothetical protein [Chryseobacterium shigense]MBB6369094.1 hypothetical protein [Chryseobacterium shigense]